jgi:hypothetical protein
MRAHTLGLLVMAASLAGCGGDNPTEPAPRYPEIAGIYDVAGNITQIPTASLSGTFTILDDGRNAPGFSGTFTVLITAPGATPVSGVGDIVNGNVTETGLVSLDLGHPDWRFTGTLSGRVINGTWLLRGDGTTGNFSGTFTASRR